MLLCTPSLVFHDWCAEGAIDGQKELVLYVRNPLTGTRSQVAPLTSRFAVLHTHTHTIIRYGLINMSALICTNDLGQNKEDGLTPDEEMTVRRQYLCRTIFIQLVSKWSFDQMRSVFILNGTLVTINTRSWSNSDNDEQPHDTGVACTTHIMADETTRQATERRSAKRFTKQQFHNREKNSVNMQRYFVLGCTAWLRMYSRKSEMETAQDNHNVCHYVNMRRKNKFICQFVAAFLSLSFLCEYLIYHIVISQCSWPVLMDKQTGKTFGDDDPVKALVIADIHLVGWAHGHWFDKLRREWQMHMAFQSATSLFQPEVVFILGDLFDKGMHCSNPEFDYYIRKLKSLFAVKDTIRIFYVPGNHDIGYHYDITPHLNKRFVIGLKAPPVQWVTIRGNHFVLMNSMAMEGDGCFICRPAQLELNKIAKRLKCAKGVGKCPSTVPRAQYSRPILLQHFPMYRESDSRCFEEDGAPEEEKQVEFHEGWDCLSREASDMIYDVLEPRVVFGGHIHHGCHVIHRKDIHEYTLSSFNWRNKNNPSFVLGVFSPNNFAVSKCPIPQETTVVFLYSAGLVLISLWLILSFKLFRPYRKFHLNLD